ncbi:uncharacterized protein I303_100335 [Kwoniella dejecticola CBS 10117]|uniref:Uncharacterized protein n=1 Tax=Kwoniella dejecticola CBS 10117 TaxID=1296121 RepID=A0A1A6AER7_9TREE|nr:uncharacterized protein I303_00335 [Kwoniella dejecticola CBS 10117]OBR88518.1 hypothetical protein I303_00335 [Kwoniella dejecticola CBS 10117]
MADSASHPPPLPTPPSQPSHPSHLKNSTAESDRVSPTIVDTPQLSGPSTPAHIETPHTIQLQTPATQAEGSTSSSRVVSPVAKAVPIADDPKGKSKAVAFGSGDEQEDDALDMQSLKRMQARCMEMENADRSGDAWTQRDELLGMMKSILPVAIEQMPFLQERLSAQKDTIQTMQQQAKLSEQLISIERSRHEAERESWHTETRALINAREAEIAARSRPRKVLDLDVGYHQELEAANKRLEMDNRLMAPRLADTQRQIDKLVTELRLLRSHVIVNSQPISRPSDPSLPNTAQHSNSHMAQMGSRHSRSPAKSSGRTVMGDARTEHLLLAASRIRTLRQADDRIGRLTLDELKRNGVIGPNGGVGYSEGYPGAESEAEDELSEEEELKPFDHARRPSTSMGKPAHRRSSQVAGTPLLPRPKKSKKTLNPPAQPTIPQTPTKSIRKQPPPQTTPGGSNFNDLLRAAELATRPGRPTPESRSQQVAPFSAMSATRSTTRARDESASERGSPVKRIRKDEWSPERQDLRTISAQQDIPSSQGSASALDLLAQASQLEVAKSGEMSSSSSNEALNSATKMRGFKEPVTGNGRSSSPIRLNEEMPLGPAIDLTTFARPKAPPFPAPMAPMEDHDHQVDSNMNMALTTPKNRPRAYSGTSDLATPVTAREYPSSTIYPTPGRERDFEDDAFASPAGGGNGIPGLGKYVHLTSTIPTRRIRSPYLKWTIEEDELLARAVAMHGEKWDLVSKGVPTRSYHQVRQRWLRKTGAFDKKPSEGQGGLDDEDDSPTPDEAKTPTASGGKKKRRMSQV